MRRSFTDRYQIEAVIGEGGMGKVYRASDRKLPGKKWAVKSIRCFDGQAPLPQEIELLTRLQHPQLPHIVDWFGPDEAGTVYIVMDLIEGQTLQSYFERKGMVFTFKEILTFVMQLCDCLAYLHTLDPQPIVYRDLKPSNVMIDHSGQLRLIDFGISQSAQTSEPLKAGTKGFAAPEQYERGLSEDQRTDLYNLGAITYYMVSGGRTISRHVEPDFRTFQSDLPLAMVHIIQKLLQNDPEKRYQTVQALQHDLIMLDRGRNSKGRQVREQIKRTSRIIIVGGLSAGAGASFAAMTLASVFHEAGVSNGLIECPFITPELYHYLYGERNCPKGYQFLIERMDKEGQEAYPEWTRGNTSWYPLPPHHHGQAWDAVRILRMLRAVTDQIVIIDVGHKWEHESVQHLCSLADSICIVADPLPSKYNSLAAQQTMKFALQLKSRGKQVEWVANRWLNTKGHREWKQSFPWEPAVYLPAVEYETLFRFAWQGKLLLEDTVFRNKMYKSLSNYVAKQIDQMGLVDQLNSGRFNKKLKKRKKHANFVKN